MDGTDTFVATVTIGSGAVLLLFWGAAAATGRLERLAGARADFGWHVAAEVVTAGLLLAGGAGVVAGASWGVPLAALGLGGLVYALVEAPGHYLAAGLRPLAVLLWGTWLVAAPAIVLVVTRT